MESKKRQLDRAYYDCNGNKKQRVVSFNTLASFRSQSEQLSSSFENLPNEIIYEVFAYLDAYHFYDAFLNLNQRFRNLIINTKHSFRISIPQISKKHCKILYKDMIQSKENRINCLRLSNPFIADILFSIPRRITKFNQLEKLIFDNVHVNRLYNILKHLVHLPKLRSLTLNLLGSVRNPDILFHRIRCLPMLKCCHLRYRTKKERTPLRIYFNKRIQSSIENLTIQARFPCISLSHLLCCFPKLRSLTIDCLIGSSNCHQFLSHVDLRDLRYISLHVETLNLLQLKQLIEKFFCQAEILRVTTMNSHSYLSAEIWQDIIQSLMPKLRIFDIVYEQTKKVDHFIDHWLPDSFRSAFWKDKKWSFIGQYYPNKKFDHGIFHSMSPYRRKDYKLCYPSVKESSKLGRSTDFNSVEHVHICNSYGIYQCTDYFSNATQLTIKCNFQFDCDRIQEVIPLKNLNKIFIENSDFSVEQILQLLSFTPDLHTLKLNSLTVCETSLTSIQLYDTFLFLSQRNKVKSLELPQWSSLAAIHFIAGLFPQVEFLKIGVVQHEILLIIRYVLTEMPHLFLLCLKQVPIGCLRDINSFIRSEQLIHNYLIKFINGDLYLWW